MRRTCCVCQAAEVWQTILRSRLAVLDESPNFKYSGEAHTGLIHGSGVLETKDERCDCSFFVHLFFVCLLVFAVHSPAWISLSLCPALPSLPLPAWKLMIYSTSVLLA